MNDGFRAEFLYPEKGVRTFTSSMVQMPPFVLGDGEQAQTETLEPLSL